MLEVKEGALGLGLEVLELVDVGGYGGDMVIFQTVRSSFFILIFSM